MASNISRAGAGLSVAVEALSGSLAACNHLDVRVFALSDHDWEQRDKNLWRGADALALSVSGPSALGYAPGTLRFLLDWRPDIVHCHGVWMHPSRSTLQWARATGLPYVVSPHGMLAPHALKFSSLKKKLSRFLYQDACFERARLLCATSSVEADDIRAFGLCQPIAIIPNGIDLPPRVAAHAISDAPYVLSLGRIHPIKALDRLVLAWAEIEPAFPHWRLKIVGPCEGGYSQKLLRLIGELGLKNVVVSGPVFGAEKLELLREAELFALPTLNENFAMTVAESLAVETPVISTIGAPWAGLVPNECGWWIDHGPAPMAAALREAMLLSPEARRTMGANGRAWMERDFDWRAIAGQMADVYRWLAMGGERPECVRVS